jgi:hypothetical protein
MWHGWGGMRRIRVVVSAVFLALKTTISVVALGTLAGD